MCTTPCAVALREKNNYADLTGLARIRWVTKVSGFMRSGQSSSWVTERGWSAITPTDIDPRLAAKRFLAGRRPLAAARHRRGCHEGEHRRQTDLGKVDEIGFVDLVPGSWSRPWRLDRCRDNRGLWQIHQTVNFGGERLPSETRRSLSSHNRTPVPASSPARTTVPSSKSRPTSVTPCGTRRGG